MTDTHTRYPALDALEEAGEPLTYDAARAALGPDVGDAPCSRYGTQPYQWAPVAAAVAVILDREAGGEGCYGRTLEHVTSLVVNDHEDPAYLLWNYGEPLGFDPHDYLTDEVIDALDPYDDDPDDDDEE